MIHDNSMESYRMGLKDYKPRIINVLKDSVATRQDLASLFGCNTSDICQAVKQLLNDSTIIESGTDRTHGRPRALLTLNRGQQHELPL